MTVRLIKKEPDWNSKRHVKRCGEPFYDQLPSQGMAPDPTHAIICFNEKTDTILLVRPKPWSNAHGFYEPDFKNPYPDEQPVCLGRISGARDPLELMEREFGYFPCGMSAALFLHELRRFLDFHVPDWREMWGRQGRDDHHPNIILDPTR